MYSNPRIYAKILPETIISGSPGVNSMSFVSRKEYGRGGFTLVELITAIAILSVLAAVLIQAVNRTPEVRPLINYVHIYASAIFLSRCSSFSACWPPCVLGPCGPVSVSGSLKELISVCSMDSFVPIPFDLLSAPSVYHLFSFHPVWCYTHHGCLSQNA